MTWCEDNGINYIFGLSGTKLARNLDEVADDIRTPRAIEYLAVLRRSFQNHVQERRYAIGIGSVNCSSTIK